MRGQFVRGDGLIIPNNISVAGAQMILGAAFRNTVPNFFFGLVTGMPSDSMTLADMAEPTIGVNGYQRIQVLRGTLGFPTLGVSGNESYISTDWLVWQPTGGAFDQPIQRVALFNTVTPNPANPIHALSSALPAPIVLSTESDLSLRRYKYQIFL